MPSIEQSVSIAREEDSGQHQQISRLKRLEDAPSRTALWVGRLVVAAVVLVSWQVAGSKVSPLFMSYPTAVVHEAISEIQSRELPSSLGSSLESLVLGFVIATVLGLLIGLILGRYRLIAGSSDWLLNALYAMPLVAITPLVIVWFGLGFPAKLFIVVALAIFPIIINTAAGVREVDDALLDVGRAFVGSEGQVFRKIILPGSLPFIMTGLRLSIGRALIGVVVAEFFTGITGLGAMIVKYGNNFNTAAMLVPVLTLMLLGVVLTELLKFAERRATPWKVH